MFGKDRFQFESPNVVDPGEMPPSAPTRTGRSAQQDRTVSPPETPRTPERRIINVSMEYGDARDSATHFLKDVEVSPTRGIVTYTAETFHDEEEPLMEGDAGDTKLNTGLKHSVKFGKMYPESLSSNSSTSSFSLSQPSLRGQKGEAGGWRRPSRRGRKLVIPDRSGNHDNMYGGGSTGVGEDEPGYTRKLLLFFCLAPVVLLFLAIVPLSHLIRQEKKEQDPYHGRTNERYISERMLETIDMLVDTGVSDKVALSVQGTPQNLAAKWLADVDPLQYTIPSPTLPPDESYHFIQRYVLVLLYHATGGNKTWHNNLDFLSEHHECSWYHSKKFTDGGVYAMGASCRGDDLQVTDLLVPANKLKGRIPTELVQLSHLELLSLSHNQMTGTVPDLSRLSGLKYIDIGTNKLTGSMPAWIDSWSDLKVLGLENNRITGTIPESLASLTKLVTLDLKKNLLKGSIDVINSLTGLEYLYLGQNSFAGFVDAELFLADVQNVRELDISNNLFYGDDFPMTLLKRPHLQVMDVSANALRGSIPPAIESNSVLEVIEINGNGFTGVIPSSIQNLENLKHLDMQMNHFNGTIPDHFVNLRHLTYLSLGENDFTPGPIPAFLSSFTALRELSLARTNRVGKIPGWFDIMSNLKFLNLQANELEGSIPEEVWALPNLSILLLTDNKLNGTMPSAAANIENFQILSMTGNDYVGEADTLCNAAPKMDAFSFDCALITCTSECCNACCKDYMSSLDSMSCYSKQLMNALGQDQRTWEFKYRSTAYSFSPAILHESDNVNEKRAPTGGTAAP
ncbi:serine threonine-protein kinase BRI1-like [Seminavis robusta]|uniref:Serine threonine-protein kinase BRI1-like n=1 Tax=Seminavis robusta TaxID=568900 RepID=A0A9N8EHX0_9STRA|nr:serine threonine-protein kinase BRI1-like [Seminavis robusta]|eukprot:Sro979_g227310.1 serine threonine-protein kinase BRI1-like (797) ;mRNA; f:32776-35419